MHPLPKFSIFFIKKAPNGAFNLFSFRMRARTIGSN